MSADVVSVLDAVVDKLGGTRRDGQIEMAKRVSEAISKSEHLLVQAGTGTGKSLGYLVPSLLSSRPVVVATATLQLQNQLISRDLPAAVAGCSAAGVKPPHYAVLKGRSNYACLNRVRDGVPDDQDTLIDVSVGELGRQVMRLRDWAEESAENNVIADRDSAPEHTDRAWRQISVSARECLGAERCSFAAECFAELAKEQAAQADVVVTNHALLSIDAIDGVPLLPEHDTVVIDEAHELVSRVTQASTRELFALAVERAARAAQSHIDDHTYADLIDGSDALAMHINELSEGRLRSIPDEVRTTLEFIRDTAREGLSQVNKADKDAEADAGRQVAKAQLSELRDTAERMAASSQNDVLWCSGETGAKHLRISPLDVAGSLREKLFGDRTCVLTSATLKIGGDFTALAASVGLADGEWTGVDVGSPFDYQKQGILYVAEHLPAPGRGGLDEHHVEELAELIKAAGGHTLGLFSSRRAAEYAAEYVREQLPDMTIWCQGDAHLTDLMQRFIEEPESCLFGTLGLWQGLDAPGDTCRLVVIDRIPFPRPDDPVMSARTERVGRSGGNGFMQVSATHAALLLAQGSGRLIRTTHDRGVVAVLDARLAKARYGSFLASTMPPLWRTTNREAVLSALSRLAGS